MNVKKILTTLSAAAFCAFIIAVPVKAANVTVSYVVPYGVVQKTVPQGTDMTYQGPTDVNIPGYAFCGWSVPLANVQTDLIAWAIYVPTGTEAQSVEVCNTYHNLPTGVLSYTTGDISVIPEATRNIQTTPTPQTKPCTLTADDTFRLNPVGIPGVTCVVKWYNGSTGELWKTDVVWYGQSLPDPATPCIQGLEFTGWDGSWHNITEDRNIIACYYKNNRVWFYSGKDGSSLGDKFYRSTDNLAEVAASVTTYMDLDHWETTRNPDGTLNMVAIPKK
ncbi:MAG: hypothetical protein K6G22_08530 [Lachnospiraceae bacterium]|nr:hypothetical protein [Lachnospiraceae bacterium]